MRRRQRRARDGRCVCVGGSVGEGGGGDRRRRRRSNSFPRSLVLVRVDRAAPPTLLQQHQHTHTAAAATIALPRPPLSGTNKRRLTYTIVNISKNDTIFMESFGPDNGAPDTGRYCEFRERERGGVPHAAAAVVLKHLCSVALWPPNPSCKKTPSGAHTQLITQTKCTHHTLGVGDNGASSTFSVREALSGETNQHSDVDGWRARATPAPTACFALLPRARCLRVAVADNLTHHPPTTPANKKRRRCATVEDQAGPCRDVLPGVCWLDERQ